MEIVDALVAALNTDESERLRQDAVMSASDRVQLDVGGQLFQTTRTTLNNAALNFFTGLLEHRTIVQSEPTFLDRV